MRKMPRTALFTLALSVLVGGITFARPSWPQELGIDFWTLPHLQEQLDAEQRRTAELRRRDAAVQRRLCIKEAIVSELLDGLIGLPEAARQFLAINHDWPEAVFALRLHFQGANDEVRAARQVIAFVRARQTDDYRVTQELLTDLERAAGGLR